MRLTFTFHKIFSSFFIIPLHLFLVFIIWYLVFFFSTCSFFLIKEMKWEGQIALRTFYRPGSTGNISSLKNLWQVTGTIYWGFLWDRLRIVKGNFSKRRHDLSWFSWEQLGLIRHNLQLVLVTSEYLLTSSLYAKQRLISTWFITWVLFPCSVPIFLFKCKSFWFNDIN